MLELAEVNPFYTFTSDKLTWTKGYWRFLTRAYGPKRNFLSHDKIMMNILRFSLFALLESRLHRVESKSYQDTFTINFQNYLTEFRKIITSQTQILTAQKTILSNLLSEEGNPSGLNPSLIDCPPCENVQNQYTPPELTIILKKLNTIAEIISKLGHLNSFKNDLERLYQKLNTNTISQNLANIENNLNSFTKDFNATLNLFANINSQLDKINKFYEEYKLVYVVYTILTIVLILVLMKIFSLVVYLLSLCKEYGQIIRDFQAFRQERHYQNQNQNRQRHHEERAYPLMTYTGQT